MNITVIRLVIIATSTGFIVMFIILTVVVAFFECVRYFYFPWPRLTTARLDIAMLKFANNLSLIRYLDSKMW